MVRGSTDFVFRILFAFAFFSAGFSHPLSLLCLFRLHFLHETIEKYTEAVYLMRAVFPDGSEGGGKTEVLRKSGMQ